MSRCTQLRTSRLFVSVREDSPKKPQSDPCSHERSGRTERNQQHVKSHSSFSCDSVMSDSDGCVCPRELYLRIIRSSRSAEQPTQIGRFNRPLRTDTCTDVIAHICRCNCNRCSGYCWESPDVCGEEQHFTDYYSQHIESSLCLVKYPVCKTNTLNKNIIWNRRLDLIYILIIVNPVSGWQLAGKPISDICIRPEALKLMVV